MQSSSGGRKLCFWALRIFSHSSTSLSSLELAIFNFTWHSKEAAQTHAHTQHVTRRWCKSKQDIISKDWRARRPKKVERRRLQGEAKWKYRRQCGGGGGGWGWKRAGEKDKGHSSFAAGGTRKRFYLRRWFIASIYLSWYTRARSAVQCGLRWCDILRSCVCVCVVLHTLTV